MPVKPAYAGEAMLLRWSETPKGRTVTLLLDALEGDQHPFKNLKCGESGQRMQIAAVLVGDDELPVSPPVKKGPVAQLDEHRNSTTSDAGSSPVGPTTKERTPFRDLPRSQQAALRCQDQEFIEWINAVDDSSADALLKRKLGIASKKELDIDGPKSAAFDRLLTDYDLRHTVRA